MSPATRAGLNLSVGRHCRNGQAMRRGSRLICWPREPLAQRHAPDYSILAAREATARLGHEDACAHYLRALAVIE